MNASSESGLWAMLISRTPGVAETMGLVSEGVVVTSSPVAALLTVPDAAVDRLIVAQHSVTASEWTARRPPSADHAIDHGDGGGRKADLEEVAGQEGKHRLLGDSVRGLVGQQSVPGRARGQDHQAGEEGRGEGGGKLCPGKSG